MGQRRKFRTMKAAQHAADAARVNETLLAHDLAKAQQIAAGATGCPSCAQIRALAAEGLARRRRKILCEPAA